jgi:hypothetical protein
MQVRMLPEVRVAQMPLWWRRNGTRKAASFTPDKWIRLGLELHLPRFGSNKETIVWAGWGPT